jgi:DNA-binding Lrp family transcriptional regulator
MWYVMEKLKPFDHQLLFELMKNAKRSDRQLAKVLGMSQATVTRKRTFLEKEIIAGYTTIPKWKKIGYEILAITLVKIKAVIASKKHYDTIRKRGVEWLMSQPNIVMAGGCRGMGMDSFMISFHNSYTDYDDFMRNYKLELADTIDDVHSILVNLNGTELLKPFHLKYLAEAK